MLAFVKFPILDQHNRELEYHVRLDQIEGLLKTGRCCEVHTVCGRTIPINQSFEDAWASMVEASRLGGSTPGWGPPES